MAAWLEGRLVFRWGACSERTTGGWCDVPESALVRGVEWLEVEDDRLAGLLWQLPGLVLDLVVWLPVVYSSMPLRLLLDIAISDDFDTTS